MNNRLRNRIISAVFVIGIASAGIFTGLNGGLIPDSSPAKSIVDLPEHLDTSINEKVPGRYTLVNVNGLFQKLAERRMVEDAEADVYRMKNGQLIYGMDSLEASIPAYADNTASFCKALKEHDIPLLYVQLPYKIENGAIQMPAGTTEYANSDANLLVSELNNRGVNTLDLRDYSDEAISFVQKLDPDCREYSSLFYNTDQHWTNETALWAASKITEIIKNPATIKADSTTMSPDNFEMSRREDSFLGSFGKKTGAWYGGMDDYDLVLPKFDTNMTFTIKSHEGDDVRSGSFEESMLDMTNLNGNPFEVNTYETYTGGNYAYTITENHKSKGPRVLLIRDSFSCAMMPFLALECSEVTAIDLRYLASMTALDFALEDDYDAVVIAYNPSMFGENTFKFK